MSNERKLIDCINEFYKAIEIEMKKPLTNEQKMLFETGVAKGIEFVLSNAVVDLSVLGQYSPE